MKILRIKIFIHEGYNGLSQVFGKLFNEPMKAKGKHEARKCACPVFGTTTVSDCA